jgi:hypothetical protein
LTSFHALNTLPFGAARKTECRFERLHDFEYQGSARVSWDFFQRYDESWIWRRADRNVVTESTRNFARYEECVEDATRHGYAGENAMKGLRAQRRTAQTSGNNRKNQAARG